MAAIASEAKLSKGTFYWHFKGKEDLFRTLLDERIDGPIRDLLALTASARADEATAPVVNDGLATLLEQERDLVLLLHEYWSAAVHDDELRARYLERQVALRDALARALTARHERTGVELSVPADSLATAFIALAEGLSRNALLDREAVQDLYGEVLSLVYDGLAARSA